MSNETQPTVAWHVENSNIQHTVISLLVVNRLILY